MWRHPASGHCGRLLYLEVGGRILVLGLAVQISREFQSEALGVAWVFVSGWE